MALTEEQRILLEQLRGKQERRTALERGAAVPEPQPLERIETAPPQDLAELTRGIISRPSLAGVGGLVGTAVGGAGGGAAGLATGPAAPAATPLGAIGGAAAGGALGTAAGSALFDNLNNIAAQTGLIDPQAAVGATEVAKRAAEEAVFDLGAGAVFQIFRPILAARSVIGKIFGVTSQQAQQAARAAELAGLTVQAKEPGIIRRALGAVGAGPVPAVGAADVGNIAPKTLSKVLSVFPLTGTPARRNLIAKQGAVIQRLSENLDVFAPNAVLRNQAGIDITQAASERFGKVRKVAGRLYDEAFTAMSKAVDADGNPAAIVPTDSIRAASADLVNALSQGKITLINDEALPTAVRESIAESTIEFLTKLEQLPERLTGPQYKALMKTFRGTLDEIESQLGRRAQTFQELSVFKEAAESDFRNLDLRAVAPDVAEQIIETQRAADSFYSNALARFETATAKKFGQVNRNIFGPGAFKAGSKNADEMLDVVFNLRSRQAIDDLEAVIGPNNMKRAARTVLERAQSRATDLVTIGDETVERLNPQKLLAELGVGTRRGTDEGLEALMNKAGVDFDRFKDVLNTAARIQDVADPSTFVTRRVTLGGAGALTGALGAGAAVGAGVGGTAGVLPGVLTTAGLTFLARRVADIATSPTALKQMQTVLDESLSTAVRQKAFGTLLTRTAQIIEQRQEIQEQVEQRQRQNRFRLEPIGP